MNGILNSSRAAARAWTMFSGIKQSWSRVCTTYTRNWTANLLQLGLSSVKVEVLASKKCDIFATLYHSTYSGDLTPQCKKNIFSRNDRGNGRIWHKLMKYITKHSTVLLLSGGRAW